MTLLPVGTVVKYVGSRPWKPGLLVITGCSESIGHYLVASGKAVCSTLVPCGDVEPAHSLPETRGARFRRQVEEIISDHSLPENVSLIGAVWPVEAAEAAKGQHPSSIRFHQLLADAGAMHDRKSKDYGTDTDPFANVRASEEWGMPAWVGCMVRASDKVRRLQTFAAKGSLANEPVADAFMDLAVYAIIGLVLFEQEVAA